MSDTPTDNTYSLGINAGFGTPDFAIAGDSPQETGCAGVFGPISGSFAICDTGFVGVPEVPNFVLSYIVGHHTNWYEPAVNIPSNCVAVKLLAECATLDLSGATYDTENIWPVKCYENVAAIDWNAYGKPCL